MKKKILSLLLVSFSIIIIKVYPQSSISKEIRDERGVSKQVIPANSNAVRLKTLPGLNENSDLGLQKTGQDDAWHAMDIGDISGCGVPTGLAASPVNSTTEHVSWEAVPGATSYRLQYKRLSSSGWTVVKVTTGSSYNIAGLTP